MTYAECKLLRNSMKNACIYHMISAVGDEVALLYNRFLEQCIGKTVDFLPSSPTTWNPTYST